MSRQRWIVIVALAVWPACAAKQVATSPAPEPQVADDPPAPIATPTPEPTPAPAPDPPPQRPDHAIIAEAFARDFDKVQACYKAQLRKQRGLHGKVTLAFNVDNTTHHPIDVRTIAPTTISSPAMTACMLGVVRDITFEADVAAKERETEFHFDMEH